jgi:16S rRNA (guanine527-N7)-methyltransferase
MSDFRVLIEGARPEMPAPQVDRLVRFRDLVIDENSRQNLTRLTEASQFWDGLVLDAVVLQQSGLLEFPALDLGTGSGVPGLVCALLGESPWILVDSERRKTEFVARAAQELGVQGHVSVRWGRIEALLPTLEVGSVVAKAVGPVERIYGWIRGCSTWNSLVLLKGPAWDEEWAEFLASKFGKELQIDRVYEYRAGDRLRRLVRLVRV